MFFQKTKSTKGFTLIELLVVIAIIGILSAVVFSSLNTARAKGSNAAVKSNLHGLKNQAEIIYDNNNGVYGVALCSDTRIREALDAAGKAGSAVAANGLCNSDDLYWVASAPFKIPDNNGSLYWCVDNTGVSKGEMAALDPSDTTCL